MRDNLNIVAKMLEVSLLSSPMTPEPHDDLVTRQYQY
jgi:hypothetical protein